MAPAIPASPATVAVAARLTHLSASCGAGAGRDTSRPSGHAAWSGGLGGGHPRSGCGSHGAAFGALVIEQIRKSRTRLGAMRGANLALAWTGCNPQLGNRRVD